MDEYQGHYDFEPMARRHGEREHPLHDNREEDNAPTVVAEEEVTICFVKAYARKPLGPPARNVVPMNYSNGIPSWHMLENYYDEFGGNITPVTAEFLNLRGDSSDSEYDNVIWSDSESYWSNDSSFYSNSSVSSESDENDLEN